MAMKRRKKKSPEICWPSGVRAVLYQDPCRCVGDDCQYHHIQFPHSDVLARAIKEIVNHYNFDASSLPNCVPLRAKYVNDTIKEARKIMRLKGRTPRMVMPSDPVRADLINEMLLRCLIRPIVRHRMGIS
jgi:hypothetical protein